MVVVYLFLLFNIAFSRSVVVVLVSFGRGKAVSIGIGLMIGSMHHRYNTLLLNIIVI